jgi:glucuronide carrier protein
MATTDQMTATTQRAEPLTIKNYLAYAAGDAANNVSFLMSSIFLILYYTNVVGIEGAVIGTMFLAVRFVDAFTDLAVGRFVDARQPSKLGKFRPLILWFFGPLLIVNWLMYSAKFLFPDASTGFYTAYMYVTYFLMGSLFYTLVNIAYGSMAPALTQVPTERAKLAGFRMYGSATMILAISWVVAPQISRYETDPEGLQAALVIVVGLLSIVGALLYLFTVYGTKEQVQRSAKPVSLQESFATLRTNRPLQILAAGTVFFLVGMTAMSTLGAYIALYVQNDANFIAWNQTAQTLALFVISPFIPLIVRTIGKRVGFLLVACFMYVGALILWWAPLDTAPFLGTVAFFIMGIAVFGVNTLMWALEADTVEYGEWRTGSRTEGTTYAVFSFTRKMGQALGGFVGGLALGWAGFVASEIAQGARPGPEVADGIRMWAAIIIMGGTLLGQIVMYFYPLTEQRYLEIVNEIAARRGVENEAAGRV